MTAARELKKISFGLWTFAAGEYAAAPIPFPRVLERLAQAGYDGVEISAAAPDLSLETCRSPRARHRIARLVKENGLAISGYHPDFTTAPPVAGRGSSYLDLFHRYIDVCVDIGSPMLRVDTARAPDSIPESDYLCAMNALAAVWAEAASIAEANHIAMAWEFGPATIFHRPSEIVALHQKVDHPNFKILFDTANAHICTAPAARLHRNREPMSGGVPELLKKLEGNIGAIHVMDAAAHLSERETCAHCPFEEGCLDFRILGPQLLEAPAGWWCVDLCSWPGSWELLEPCREYVLAIMGAQTAA